MGRPFTDLLREHRSGLTHDELSDALRDLVAAVFGKPQTIVIIHDAAAVAGTLGRCPVEADAVGMEIFGHAVQLDRRRFRRAQL